MPDVEIEAIIGPYRGQRLTMSDTDATAAINDHWAIDPFAPVDEEPHDPLTEAERDAAHAAAVAWQKAQQDAAAGTPPAGGGEEGGGEAPTKAMSAEHRGNYKTRSHR